MAKTVATAGSRMDLPPATKRRWQANEIKFNYQLANILAWVETQILKSICQIHRYLNSFCHYEYKLVFYKRATRNLLYLIIFLQIILIYLANAQAKAHDFMQSAASTLAQTATQVMRAEEMQEEFEGVDLSSLQWKIRDRWIPSNEFLIYLSSSNAQQYFEDIYKYIDHYSSDDRRNKIKVWLNKNWSVQQSKNFQNRFNRFVSSVIDTRSMSVTYIGGGDIWPIDEEITFCFYEDDPVNEQVIQVASEWVSETGLTFDFGSDVQGRLCEKEIADVRIAYDWPPPPEFWSCVGARQCLQLDPRMPSSNFHNFDLQEYDNKIFRQIVLHEFGHILGLRHEYISIAHNCSDEYNWSWIEENLDDQISTSLHFVDLSTASGGIPIMTAYDANSIMNYNFPEEMFIDGKGSKCFPKNDGVLSVTDREMIKFMYPQSNGGR